MKIESIKSFSGANIYSHQPVLMIEIDLEELKGKESREVSGFNARLLEFLPKLQEHYCDSGKPGGFVERLHAGTHFNHVVEHAAVELLALAGIDRRHEKSCNGDEKDDSKAVIETTTVETARYLMTTAAELVEAVVNEKTFFIEEKITEAKDIAADTELGPSAAAIVEAAERRGIPWRRENIASLIQLGYGKNLRQVQAAITDGTGVIGVDLAKDKDLTKQRLNDFSIPVPDGEIVRTEREAARALELIGAPVVVKPLDGRQGKGVSLNLRTPAEVIEAFQIAREYSRKVLVEELFEGKNYRVLVIDGKMVAASERVPCGVVGDGEHTVAQLIDIENQNPLRGEGHEKPLTKIKIDPIILSSLQKEGWKMEDVPPVGERVSLCAGMNLSTGGTARDVTDDVHRSVKILCERAARVIGLDICGVDLVLEDISAPMPKEKGGVIEINAAPGLRMHTFPSEGKPRDVGGAIIEMLYPNGKEARIPIISVTGTNGKTTVTRMISHILNDGNLTVGTTTSTGIYLNGEQIVKGDTTGPISARTILGDRAVDVAVLETARGGIVRRGLAYDWSDISVLTNITEDHIGQDGIESIEDLINIKALVPERVRAGGTLILNADDETSGRVLERENVKRIDRQIVYFSLGENNPRVREHVERGGTAYVAKNDFIVEITGAESCRVVDSRELPVTLNGTADFQTANAMAAIAACRAYGMAREEIVSRLKTFRTDSDNPGRNNLYKVGKGYALVDYGHNPDGFAAICRMVSRWEGKTITGIINIAGDRDDRIVREAARVAARCFRRVIATEDLDRRGRAPGEIPRLLCEAIRQENPDCHCDIMPNEAEAVSKAIREIKENEVVVIFYDQLSAVLDIFAQNGAVPVSSFEETASAR
ncbi:MAG TPA: cyanophycin synthetase [Pyrinomonadaceae bacterium]|jgi:cyanophycin synthetase